MKIMLYRALIIAALLALAALPAVAQPGAGAQSQQSTKGAVIKNKAPVNRDVLRVKLPRPYETTLSNGIQVVVLESHKVPTFSMQMVVMGGGMLNSDEELGLAQFTASLLREGTKTRNSRQIAEEIDALGASLSASSGLASTTTNVSASGLADNFDKVMELFADVILNPTFPEDEFNKLKSRTLAGLRAQRAQAGFLADEKMSQVMYGKHPGARESMNPAALQKLTPDALRKFHGLVYKPGNAMFTIVGDVRPAEIVAKLEKTFASWQRGDAPKTNIPAVSETGAARIYLIDRPGSVQTNLLASTLSIERTDPDYPVLQVMNKVLGGGASARLFLNLREDKGYTYGAYSSVSALKYRGTFEASTEVRTDVTDGSMKELLYELRRIRDEKVPAEELENAKRSIVGSFALQLESPQSILGNVVTQKLYNLPADYWDTYPQKIAAVTADDVQRVARKYLNLDKLQIVAVGDGAKVLDVLKKYGPVEVFDTEGRPADAKPPATISASSTPGTGISGVWNLMVSSPQGEMPLKTILKQEGEMLSGTLDTPFGQFPFSGGKVSGSDVSFKAKIEVQGNPLELECSGKVEGDAMKGTLKSAMFPEMPFSGKKEK